MPGPFKSMGHMVGGLKMRMKPECVLYSIMGWPRIIYIIIKIIPFIVNNILLFYVIFVWKFSN